MPWEIRVDLVPRIRFRDWLNSQEEVFDAQMREEKDDESRAAMVKQFTIACSCARLISDTLLCEKLQGTLKGHHNGNRQEAGQLGNRLTIDIAEVRLLGEGGASAR